LALAALLNLVLTVTAQAQYAQVQSAPAGYSGYGYPYGQAYVYRVAPTTYYSQYGYGPAYYSGGSQMYYRSSYSRVYPQPGLGRDWESRLSYASYPRTATYSRGYSITQPYYYAGHGYGTMTRAVLPSGVSVRSWNPPFQVR
jgi:hypothetical protein